MQVGFGEIMKAILIIIAVVIAIWCIMSGAGSLLFLFGLGAYVFVMKNGR